MAKGKKGKGKKAPKILTPKRCTINIVYCWRGLSMGTLGMGGPYRRIRTLLLMEFRRAEISIVGNGTAALPSSEPLTVKLVETGEDLGSLDWSLSHVSKLNEREEAIVAIVEKTAKQVRKYLSTPIEGPSKFRGSAAGNLTYYVTKKKKGKGKKKK